MLHGLPSTEPVHWGLAFCITFAQSHFGCTKSFHDGFFFCMFRQKMIVKKCFFFYWVESWVPSCWSYDGSRFDWFFYKHDCVQIETLLYKNRRENTYCPVIFNSSDFCGVCIEGKKMHCTEISMCKRWLQRTLSREVFQNRTLCYFYKNQTNTLTFGGGLKVEVNLKFFVL